MFLPEDGFYYTPNRSGTKSRDRLCKSCRKSYYRDKYAIEKGNEKGNLRRQIADLQRYIKAGVPDGYQSERRAWRTMQEFKDRLRALV